MIAEAFRLGPSHTSCLHCSPGVQAAANREDLSYDLKSTDDIFYMSEHYCCCLKNLSRRFPVWILHDKGPVLQSYFQTEQFLKVTVKLEV